MQPTQAIQSIRYLPQYRICLVNEMNVLDSFKILETYWTDWIGCIGEIDGNVWIECKSIQSMQPIQSNQPFQYSQWNELNSLNWFRHVDFDLIRFNSTDLFFCLFRDFWNFAILAVAPANGFGTWPGGVPVWQTFLVNSKAQFQWLLFFFFYNCLGMFGVFGSWQGPSIVCHLVLNDVHGWSDDQTHSEAQIPRSKRESAQPVRWRWRG